MLEQLQTQLRSGSLLGCYAVSSAEIALAELLGLPQPRTTPLCRSFVQLAAACEALLLGQQGIKPPGVLITGVTLS